MRCLLVFLSLLAVIVGVAMWDRRNPREEEGYGDDPPGLLKIRPVEIKDHKCGRTLAKNSL
jgi:hypothetical protein